MKIYHSYCKSHTDFLEFQFSKQYLLYNQNTLLEHTELKTHTQNQAASYKCHRNISLDALSSRLGLLNALTIPAG